MPYSISSDCNGCTACARICPTGAIRGEKKQIHTIDPDVCIACGACGRICPFKAVLDPFGLVCQRIPKKKWDLPRFDLEACTSCTICLDTCPAAAISQNLQLKANPHLFPVVEDDTRCIACGFCAADCPVDAITMVPRHEAGPKPASNRESRE